MAAVALAVPLLLVLVVAGLTLLVTTLVRGPAPSPSQAAEAARRHALTINVTAWVLALLAPGFLLPVLMTVLFAQTAGAGLYAGVATGLWPAVVGLVFLAVHAVGELTWPRPTGTIRRAVLTPRRTADVVPSWLRRVSWGWAAGLVVTLLVTGATAQDGRTVSVTRLVDGLETVHTAGPYPGWYYGLPLLVGAGLVLAAGEGVLRLIGRRPAVVDADPGYDAASRRLSAHRTLRGAELVLCGTLAGVLLFAGRAVANADGTTLGSVATGLGLLVALAGAGTAIVPGQPAVVARSPEPGATAVGGPVGARSPRDR